MSEAAPRTADLLPASADPVHVAARRLRWFRMALHGYLEHLGEELGCEFELDEPRVADAFVAWLRAVEAQRPVDPVARRDYFEFAAGLMLRHLIQAMPVRARTAPSRADSDSAAAFWPEGYACATFCLTVARAALRQEFGEDAETPSVSLDLRTWWSFRENTLEDPATAVGFFDLMLGREPTWLFPTLFSARLRRELLASVGTARLRL